jgi:DNA-directed RNA polymerase subunit F
MAPEEYEVKPVSISEVKNILKKVEKEREELLYEQKIALEHAQKFAKLPIKKIDELIKELSKLEFLEEIHVYKIADLLPQTEDDIKTIFAKERITFGDGEVKKILELIRKYYTE